MVLPSLPSSPPSRQTGRAPAPSLNLWRHATNVVIVVIIAGAAFTHYRQTLLALGGDAALWAPLSLPHSVPLPPPFIVQRVKSGSIVGRSDRVSRTFSAHFHADSDTTNNMTSSAPRHQTAAVGERRKQKEPRLGQKPTERDPGSLARPSRSNHGEWPG